MADGKSSFVLYTENKEVFDSLTDEQAGKLIKHIFAYVSDENPVFDDPLLKIVSIQIKQQLKRDLKKWEKRQEQRKLAGLKSAEARKKVQAYYSVKTLFPQFLGEVKKTYNRYTGRINGKKS